MCKIRNYVNPKLLRSIYFAIFECHLNYSSIFWVQKPGSIKPLIILQKKAVRIINFKQRNCHSSPLFKENAILKLIDKFHLENILFVNKCINFLYLLPPIFNDWFTLVSAQQSWCVNTFILCPQGNIFNILSARKYLMASPFTLLSRLYFINQNIIL